MDPGHPDPEYAFGVRTGENSMGSRGFSFAKMIGVLSGAIEPSEAKIEIQEVHAKLHNGLASEKAGQAAYAYGGRGITGMKRFLAPLCTKYLPDKMISDKDRAEIKSLIMAGTDKADSDEMKCIRKKMRSPKAYNANTYTSLNNL